HGDRLTETMDYAIVATKSHVRAIAARDWAWISNWLRDFDDTTLRKPSPPAYAVLLYETYMIMPRVATVASKTLLKYFHREPVPREDSVDIMPSREDDYAAEMAFHVQNLVDSLALSEKDVSDAMKYSLS